MMENGYYVKLLGAPELFENNQKVNFPFLKAKILALLIIEERHVSREKAVALLWSEKSSEAGRRNLSNALCCIRTIAPFIHVTSSALGLSECFELRRDIDNLTNIKSLEASKMAALFDVYMDLPKLDDLPLFEEWLSGRRDEYRGRLIENVKKRAQMMEQLNAAFSLADAVMCYEWLVKWEPYNEVINGELVRLYIKTDQKIKAAEAAKRFSLRIENDLGVKQSLASAPPLVQRCKKEFSIAALRLPTDDNPLERNNELVKILAFLSEEPDRDLVLPASVFVWGEEGIGKNVLINDIDAKLAKTGWKCSHIRCFQEEMNRPLASILKFLYDGSDESELERPYLTEKNIPSLIQELIKKCSLNCSYKTLLIVENIQWMDSSSWMILEAILWNSDSPRYIIVSGYEEARSLFMYRAGFIDEDFKKLEIFLGRFNRKETETICRQLKKDVEWSKEQLDDIYAKTEGNPFFIREMLDFYCDAGEYRSVKSPESRFLYRAEILSETEKFFLEAVAVFGDGVSMLQIADILQLEPLAIANSYKNIKLQGLLREYINDKGEIFYSFTHPRIREDFLAKMSVSLKKALHVKILDYLKKDQARSFRGEQEYSLLIYHSSEASFKEEELMWRIERLKFHFQHTHVISPVLSDQEITGYNPSTGDTGYVMDDIEGASALLDNLIRAHGRNERLLWAERELLIIGAGYNCWKGNFTEARTILEEVLKKALRDGTSTNIINVCEQLCYLAVETDDPKMLGVYAKKVYRLAMMEHDHLWIGTALRFLATFQLMECRYDAAVRLLDMSVRLFEKLEEEGVSYTTSLIAAEHTKGNINIARENYSEALSHFKNCMYMGESLILHRGQSLFLTKAGYCLIRLGRDKEAEEILIRTERFNNIIGSSREHFGVLQNGAITLILLGYLSAKNDDWQLAEDYWNSADKLVKKIMRPVWKGILYWVKWSLLEAGLTPPHEFARLFFSENKEWYHSAYIKILNKSSWNY
ncbi:MAG: AAA family ATPase [Cloacibacillus sp.]